MPDDLKKTNQAAADSDAPKDLEVEKFKRLMNGLVKVFDPNKYESGQDPQRDFPEFDPEVQKAESQILSQAARTDKVKLEQEVIPLCAIAAKKKPLFAYAFKSLECKLKGLLYDYKVIEPLIEEASRLIKEKESQSRNSRLLKLLDEINQIRLFWAILKAQIESRQLQEELANKYEKLCQLIERTEKAREPIVTQLRTEKILPF